MQDQTVHNRNRVSVPFLPGIHICRGCSDCAKEWQTKVVFTPFVHPSIKRIDAEREKRLREIDGKVRPLFNPKTHKHPSWSKWDAAVKSGKINLDIRARFRIVPNFPKGTVKGVRGAEVEIMDAEQAAAFRAEVKAQEERDAAYRLRRAEAEREAARQSMLAAAAASVTIGG
jgi:hypothetical protein